MKTVTDSRGTVYLQADDNTCYQSETPVELIDILQHLREVHERIKITYGDRDTGIAWPEEYDIIGFVSRSTGKLPIPILVYSDRSMGGGSILTGCILKVVTYPGRKVYYKAKNFQEPIIEIRPGTNSKRPFETWYNGQLHRTHATERSAKMCASKLR